MTEETVTLAVRVPKSKAEAFAESVMEDEQFEDKSETLRYLIDRWLEYDIW